MIRTGLGICVALLFIWGCGGESGEPKDELQQGGTPAADVTSADLDDDEGYEELDVWIEAEPDEGPPPLRVHFTSEVESDEDDGGPYHYKWDFGDGSTSTQANPVYTYKKLGEYTVTCVANDDKGNNGSDEIDVWVEEDE